MMAKTGRDPSELYRALTGEFGEPAYERIDMPATAEHRALLGNISAAQVRLEELAGEQVRAILTTAPGNGGPIGGLKVMTDNGWFAARPSGTEDLNKLYAESFLGADHLRRIQEDARVLLSGIFAATPSHRVSQPIS
jgi:phosphoglucomutase